MHLALTDLFRARWTDEIHREWMRNVLTDRQDLSQHQLERTRDLMNRHVQDCLVTGYEPLIAGLVLPDPNDRHVLAAAIRSRADVIVTYNLRDFPSDALQSWSIEAQHPDAFVAQLLDRAPTVVVEAVRSQRANLRKPQVSTEDLLLTLERQQMIQTVTRLREWRHLL